MTKLIKSLFYTFTISFLFFSCNNILSTKPPVLNNEIITVTGIVTTDNEISRSACPVIPQNLYYFVMASTEIDGENVIRMGTVTNSGSLVSYSIDLIRGYVWTINVTCYKDYQSSAYSNPLYSGEIDYDLTVVTQNTNPVIVLNDLNQGFGSVELPIEVDSSTISSCKIEWKLSSETSWSSLNSQNISFTSGSLNKIFLINSIAAGKYDLKITFYSENTILGIINDSMYVLNDLKTTEWLDNSSIYIQMRNGKNTLYMTEDLTKFFLSKYFYVSSTGSDSAAGTYYTPFSSIQHAVDVVEMINDGSSKYNIYLLNNITADNAFELSALSDNSSVIINPNKNLNLTISSYDNSPSKTITACNTSDSRAIYVGNKCKLTLDNITITGGKAEDGAGIYNEGNLVLKNCKVINNSCTNKGAGIYSNGYLELDSCQIMTNRAFLGGGIYSENSVLKIQNSIIDSNSSDDTGGGVYHTYSTINGTETFYLVNSSVGSGVGNGNSAKKHAGGLYINNTKAVISGSTISYNSTLNNLNCTGGGLWFSGPNLSFTEEKSVISHNSSLSGGGILFNKATVNLGLLDISDNIAEDSGGGIYSYNNSTIIYNNSVTIENNKANTNSSSPGYGGGGIYCLNTIIKNDESSATGQLIFNNNYSGLFGAGIYIAKNSNITLTNAMFMTNSVGTETVTRNSEALTPDGLSIAVNQTSSSESSIVKLNKCSFADSIVNQKNEIFQNSADSNLSIDSSSINSIFTRATILLDNPLIILSQLYLSVPETQSLSSENRAIVYYGSVAPVFVNNSLLPDSEISLAYSKITLSNSDYELRSDGIIYEKPLTSVETLKNSSLEPVSGKKYSVSKEAELNYIADWIQNSGNNMENVTFIQLNDIDLLDHEFSPIGFGSRPFKGTYDGKGNKIIGLKNNETLGTSKLGLFGYTYGATICNLYVSGNITGGDYLGGIVGQAVDTIIHDCVSEVTVNGSGNYLGGICGSLNDNIIYNCINVGVVTGSQSSSRYVGGIVGELKSAGIANCANFGPISAAEKTGGITGVVYSADKFVSNVYNCGKINSPLDCGEISGTDTGVFNNYYYKGPTQKKNFGNVSDTGTNIINLSTLKDDLDSGRTSVSSDYSDYFNEWKFTLSYNGSVYPVCTSVANNLSISYSEIEITSSIQDLVGFPVANCTYSVSTKEELEKLSSISNDASYTGSFSNVNIVLLNDIDLQGSASNPFTPISATSSKKFAGTFDGQGNTISGLYENVTYYGGLIGYVKEGSVKNVNVSGEIYTSSGYTGGIVGSFTHNTKDSVADLDSCISKVNIHTTGGTRVGGIVGEVSYYATVSNCINLGSIDGSASTVGGIVGNMPDNGRLYNSANFGKISSDSNVGGICGSASTSGTNGGTILMNLYNAGEVTCTGLGGDNSCGSVCATNISSSTNSDNIFVIKDTATYIFGNATDSASFVTKFEKTQSNELKDSLNNYISSSLGFNQTDYSVYKKWDKQYEINGYEYPVNLQIPESFKKKTSSSVELDSSYRDVSSYTDTLPVAGDKVKISSANDLMKFNEWCTTLNKTSDAFEDVTFALSTDINMNGVQYKSSGNNKTHFFKGTFEGNGYIISNLVISAGGSGWHGNGLIGCAGDGAIIRNVKLDNLTFDSTATQTCGGIVGFASGDVYIENCDVNLTLSSATARKGGIVGSVDSGSRTVIISCITRGIISGTNDIGGIVSTANGGSVVVENCASYCDITSTNGITGGIVSAIVDNNSTIKNCFFAGTINRPTSSGQLGPITNKIPTSSSESFFPNLFYWENFLDYSQSGNSSYNFTGPADLEIISFTKNPSAYKTNSGDNIIQILNDWCTKSSVEDFPYRRWKYDSISGELVLE